MAFAKQMTGGFFDTPTLCTETVKTKNREDVGILPYGRISVIGVKYRGLTFMTNPDEDAAMESEKYQRLMVKGIVCALERYFENGKE